MNLEKYEAKVVGQPKPIGIDPEAEGLVRISIPIDKVPEKGQIKCFTDNWRAPWKHPPWVSGKSIILQAPENEDSASGLAPFYGDFVQISADEKSYR